MCSKPIRDVGLRAEAHATGVFDSTTGVRAHGGGSLERGDVVVVGPGEKATLGKGRSLY